MRKKLRKLVGYIVVTPIAIVGLIFIINLAYILSYQQYGVLGIDIEPDQFKQLRQVMTEFTSDTNFQLRDSSDRHTKLRRKLKAPISFETFKNDVVRYPYEHDSLEAQYESFKETQELIDDSPMIFMDWYHWRSLFFRSMSLKATNNYYRPKAGIVFHTKHSYEQFMPELIKRLEQEWPGKITLKLNEST